MAARYFSVSPIWHANRFIPTIELNEPPKPEKREDQAMTAATQPLNRTNVSFTNRMTKTNAAVSLAAKKPSRSFLDIILKALSAFPA